MSSEPPVPPGPPEPEPPGPGPPGPPDPEQLRRLVRALGCFIDAAEPLAMEDTGYEDRVSMRIRARCEAYALADAWEGFGRSRRWEFHPDPDLRELYHSTNRVDDLFRGAMTRAGYVRDRVVGITLDHDGCD